MRNGLARWPAVKCCSAVNRCYFKFILFDVRFQGFFRSSRIACTATLVATDCSVILNESTDTPRPRSVRSNVTKYTDKIRFRRAAIANVPDQVELVLLIATGSHSPLGLILTDLCHLFQQCT